MKLVIDEKEGRVIRGIFFGKPRWSTLEVARYLNEKGNPKGVLRVRKRRLYCGEYEYKGQMIKAEDVPAIISKEQWILIQGVQKVGKSAYGRSRKYPLAGLAYCFYCGSRYYLHNHRNLRVGDHTQHTTAATGSLERPDVPNPGHSERGSYTRSSLRT